MQPYRYRSLRHDDSIRILVLHPSSNDSDPLMCTIQRARLSDESLKYEAVSYTWGDIAHQQTIYLSNGGRELRVGRNCYSALQHLHKKHHDRLLWIDALCIDQGNLIERAVQVRIMDRIFRSAFGVTVYLGEQTAGSRILFEELAEADRLLLQSGGLYRPSPSDTIIRELDTLIQRAWFKRVWVLQEVCMKGSITVMCGSASASSEVFIALCFGYRRMRVIKDILPFALDLVQTLPEEFSTPQFNLWHLLYNSRTNLATDPRDRVFALKSLIPFRQSEMDYLIDYVKSIEETFIETAMFLLPVLGLRILTAIRHPHKMNMPSWIPDWSQNLPLNWIYFGVESQYAPKLKPLNEQTHKIRSISDGENNRCLELLVAGRRYAQIVKRSQVFSFVSVEDAEAQMKVLYHGLDNLRKWVDLEDMKGNYTVNDQLGQEIADAMSLIDGQVLHFHLTRWDGTYFHDDAKSVIDNWAAEPFLSSIQQCRIILMDNSELAIVAGSVREGDVVCILSGTDSPCALRPGQTGNWTLVSGDCHIFTESFRFPGLPGWFMCDEFLAHNHDPLEDFQIR